MLELWKEICMDKRETYTDKFKYIIDVNSEIDWMRCRGDIDGYLIYSNIITNMFIIARRFDSH